MRLARATAFSAGIAALAMICASGGCASGQLAENQQQLKQQGQQILQLQQQIAALKAQAAANAAASAAPSAPAPGNGCDRAIVRDATRKGGERLAAGELSKALGYYEDAVTACPTDAQAQLNLARTYEAMGQHGQAVAHYKLAVQQGGSGAAAAQARDALKRLGAGS